MCGQLILDPYFFSGAQLATSFRAKSWIHYSVIQLFVFLISNKSDLYTFISEKLVGVHYDLSLSFIKNVMPTARKIKHCVQVSRGM